MVETTSAFPLHDNIVAALEGFPRHLTGDDPADWSWEETWQRTQWLLDCIENDPKAERELSRLVERRREILSLDWLKNGLRRMSDREFRPFTEPRKVSEERNARLLGDQLAGVLALRLWIRVDAWMNGVDPLPGLEPVTIGLEQSAALKVLAGAANSDPGPALAHDAKAFLAADPAARPIFEDALRELRKSKWKGTATDLESMVIQCGPLEELVLRWASFETFGKGGPAPVG
ncbi:MAG: hypothetical protein K8T20_09690 [Planctomycetes bacterium]|nr:hypothetical protein [Planctomycetota bacterium]